MIEIDDLSFGYGRRALFEHLDLSVAPGSVHGLLGVNGAGKSTLLKLMSGLLFPRSGSVRTLGYAAGRRDPGLLSRVFLLPEQLHLPSISDRAYLALRAPFYPGFDRALFERYLEELEVPRRRRLTALSYGQQKKFLLAFGLASGASLLLLDEPTNGLDIPSKAQFRRFVAGALGEQRAFIISTHQVQDVAALIDPIVILHGGRVLFHHTLAEVAARIRMSHGTTRPDPAADGLLYTEPGVQGFRSLWRADGGGDGHVDLELLFNMVVGAPEAARGLFAGALLERRAADVEGVGV